MKNNSSKAFTLIEILISIGILSIILGISLTTFKAITKQQNLDRDVEAAGSYILRARNQTITGEDNSQYGIHFSSTSVTLFKGTTYVAASSTNLEFNFNNRTYLYSSNLTGSTSDVYFKKLSGAPSATGTVIYRLGGETAQKTIYIYGSGLIEVQ